MIGKFLFIVRCALHVLCAPCFDREVGISVTVKGLGRGLDDRRSDGNGKNFFSSSERTDHPLNSHRLQWVARSLSLGMKRQFSVTTLPIKCRR